MFHFYPWCKISSQLCTVGRLNIFPQCKVWHHSWREKMHRGSSVYGGEKQTQYSWLFFHLCHLHCSDHDTVSSILEPGHHKRDPLLVSILSDTHGQLFKSDMKLQLVPYCEALARLHKCTRLPKPFLFAHVLSSLFHICQHYRQQVALKYRHTAYEDPGYICHICLPIASLGHVMCSVSSFKHESERCHDASLEIFNDLTAWKTFQKCFCCRKYYYIF